MKRRRRKTQIGGAFAWRLIELLESPVMRVLNQSEHRVLMRLEVALGHHGGTKNGSLIVTYKAFRSYGVDPQAIAPSLRVLIALGLIEKTRQGSGGRTEYHDASEYRLTYRHTDTENPSDEWRHIKTFDEAKQIAAEARKAKASDAVERSIRSAKKHSPGVEKSQIPGWKNQPGNSKVSGRKSHRSTAGGDSHPSIYISGRDTAQPAREARPSKGAVASGQAATGTQLPPSSPTGSVPADRTDKVRLDLLQTRVAAKLGERGWEILQDLTGDELNRLLELERNGDLKETVLEAVRIQHHGRWQGDAKATV
jgi:hypothetical protein